jgi:hypothetical protein
MLDIIIYGIILYFIYAILFKKSLTEKHREYKKKIADHDDVAEKAYDQFKKAWEVETGKTYPTGKKFSDYRKPK